MNVEKMYMYFGRYILEGARGQETKMGSKRGERRGEEEGVGRGEADWM